jgi:hypothetical protein
MMHSMDEKTDSKAPADLHSAAYSAAYFAQGDTMNTEPLPHARCKCSICSAVPGDMYVRSSWDSGSGKWFRAAEWQMVQLQEPWLVVAVEMSSVWIFARGALTGRWTLNQVVNRDSPISRQWIDHTSVRNGC